MMWDRYDWAWLLDDWERAVRRSLGHPFGRSQVRALRWQRRCGQGVKLGLLLLGGLAALSFVAPGSTALAWGLVGWCLLEELLLVAHLALGLRFGVSFGWALHHGHPALLGGRAARRDLKQKALFAALIALFFLQSLLLLVSG